MAIGVLCREDERGTVREFFELFKTPWEFCVEGREYEVLLTTLDAPPEVNARVVICYSSRRGRLDEALGISTGAASSSFAVDATLGRMPIYGKAASITGEGLACLRGDVGGETLGLVSSVEERRIFRVGYDLFREIGSLLSVGQPAENASVPTLECHISLLRNWIVGEGVPLIEIPAQPMGFGFIACLTHDVDFAGIRRHVFDRTMWGFVSRAVVGSLVGVIRGRYGWDRLARNWIAVASLPLIYAGLMRDFWDQFDGYMEMERGLRSTFFLIPHKDKPGDPYLGASPPQRATRYDIEDVKERVASLRERDFEIGVHGIDAWSGLQAARTEARRVIGVTGEPRVGIRMHWLFYDKGSAGILERAGFEYDASLGFNDAVGYRSGTSQAFIPPGLNRLVELPLHVQDTALLLPRRMDLSEDQAWDKCMAMLDCVSRFGGVVTFLWHMRSIGPERLWGDLYVRLLDELKRRGAWIGTAREVVDWFRARRSVKFEDCTYDSGMMRIRLSPLPVAAQKTLILRVHMLGGGGALHSPRRTKHVDLGWSGEEWVDIALA
jgi:hypothetical protein